ncbi:hypothetical protein HanPI659440_Chr03g0125911 [Helianthus annuus]|nr:hypothetical protein HanPI659440_Chr03g0125911 [Helianthus annuus]
MGQAFRRASGRIRTPAPPSSSSQLNKPLDRTQPAASVDNKVPVGGNVDPSSDGQPRNTPDDVPEERDSEYDAMLSKMVGRIQTKPGGKLEMGEVS